MSDVDQGLNTWNETHEKFILLLFCNCKTGYGFTTHLLDTRFLSCFFPSDTSLLWCVSSKSLRSEHQRVFWISWLFSANLPPLIAILVKHVEDTEKNPQEWKWADPGASGWHPSPPPPKKKETPQRLFVDPPLLSCRRHFAPSSVCTQSGQGHSRDPHEMSCQWSCNADTPRFEPLSRKCVK